MQRAKYFFCVLLLSVFAACSSGTGPNKPANAGNATASSSGGQLKLAFVTNNASDYWTIARKGVESADNELPDVTVDFKMPGEGSAAEQKRIIDDLISVGVNGMAISPVD